MCRTCACELPNPIRTNSSHYLPFGVAELEHGQDGKKDIAAELEYLDCMTKLSVIFLRRQYALSDATHDSVHPSLSSVCEYS